MPHDLFIDVLVFLIMFEVRGASLEDGILSIHMEEVVPEEEKPKKIEIGEVIDVKEKEFLTG